MLLPRLLRLMRGQRTNKDTYNATQSNLPPPLPPPQQASTLPQHAPKKGSSLKQPLLPPADPLSRADPLSSLGRQLVLRRLDALGRRSREKGANL